MTGPHAGALAGATPGAATMDDDCVAAMTIRNDLARQCRLLRRAAR